MHLKCPLYTQRESTLVLTPLYIHDKIHKTCLKWPLLKRPKIGFQGQLLLNAGQKYCSILQYFRPSLSYHLSLRPMFCLFLSGFLRQALLYGIWQEDFQIRWRNLFSYCQTRVIYNWLSNSQVPRQPITSQE